MLNFNNRISFAYLLENFLKIFLVPNKHNIAKLEWILILTLSYIGIKPLLRRRIMENSQMCFLWRNDKRKVFNCMWKWQKKIQVRIISRHVKKLIYDKLKGQIKTAVRVTRTRSFFKPFLPMQVSLGNEKSFGVLQLDFPNKKLSKILF